MLLLWSLMFFVAVVFASAVGAVALMGMPVGAEIQAVVVVIAAAVVVFGLALRALRPFPKLTDHDEIPPYVFGARSGG